MMKMKRNKFTDFILSLEEKMPLGNFYVQKKYVLIGILGMIIYILIAVYNANSVRLTNVGEKREVEYKELNNNEQEMEPFTETPSNEKTYEENINEILEMSNEEIRALLKEQNIYLTDEEILKFKEEDLIRNTEELKKLEEGTMKKIYEEAEKMTKEQKK